MSEEFTMMNPYGVDTSYESEMRKIRAHHTVRVSSGDVGSGHHMD